MTDKELAEYLAKYGFLADDKKVASETWNNILIAVLIFAFCLLFVGALMSAPELLDKRF